MLALVAVALLLGSAHATTSLCDLFSSGSFVIGSDPNTVNATLSWQHNCANGTTTFTLEGTVPNNGTGTSGWIGVGFIAADKLNSSQAMANADLYLFTQFNGSVVVLNGLTPKNGRPSAQNASDVISSATVLPRSGDLFAVSFTRAWAAQDATHADLTVPLRVLGARGFYADGSFGWHGHQNATLVVCDRQRSEHGQHEWQHDCANDTTTLTLEGTVPNNGTGTSGWLGVGLIAATS
jgi:hypothetical protein